MIPSPNLGMRERGAGLRGMTDRRDRRRPAAPNVPLPRASGHECVRVLVSLGWLPLSWTDRECLIERGHFQVTVPLDPRLDSETLVRILRETAIGTLSFVDALERIRTGSLRAYADEIGAKRKG